MKQLLFSSFEEWRSRRSLSRPGPVHFVPTMGALHAGHGTLIAEARRKAGKDGEVVVSVFINPTQFDDPEDLAAYPSTIERDCALANSMGADAVVAPSVMEMYPNGLPVKVPRVDFGSLTDSWEAQHRPGHFDGVVMVVRKLFHQVLPEAAYFGEKDWQQLAVVRRMAESEFPGLKVVPVATVREPSGLAMSSRNERLTVVERERASELHQSLLAVAESLHSAEESRAQIERLEQLGFEVEYLAEVDALTLALNPREGRERRIIAAAHWGGVRLIDNVPCRS